MASLMMRFKQHENDEVLLKKKEAKWRVPHMVQEKDMFFFVLCLLLVIFVACYTSTKFEDICLENYFYSIIIL